jgi:hypothetical protein
MGNKIDLSVTYGASPGSVTDGVTGFDLITGDNATYTSANRVAFPIRVPSSGTNYSYEKYVRLRAKNAPSAQLYNFKVWGPAAVPETGVTMYWKAVAAYATPTTPTSTAGYTRQDTNYTSSGSALTISGTLTASGEYSDYLVMMYTCGSTATQGTVTQININYSYDEQ